MSKSRELSNDTYDYDNAWIQFVEKWHTNKLLDELYNELDRRNNATCKEREKAKYDYDYETDDDD